MVRIIILSFILILGGALYAGEPAIVQEADGSLGWTRTWWLLRDTATGTRIFIVSDPDGITSVVLPKAPAEAMP